jgi:hypothetical protein
MAATDLPYVPMFQGEIAVVVKTGVQGVVLDATVIVKYYLISKQA